MNVSKLVHGRRFRQEQSSLPYSVSNHPPTMATSLVASPYTVNGPHHGYNYMTAPQAPPSPPVEEAPRCSLPSISSLLGIADGPSAPEQSHQENLRRRQQQQQQQHQQHQQQQQRPYQQHPQHSHHPPPSQYPAEYHGQGSGHAGPLTANMRTHLPPTPPMQPESGFDERHSPSTTPPSPYGAAGANGYYFSPASTVFSAGSAINNVEPHAQRPPQPPSVSRRVTTAIPTPYGTATSSPYTSSPYSARAPASTAHPSMSPYYASPAPPQPPPEQHQHQQQQPHQHPHPHPHQHPHQHPHRHVSGLYYQRPLVHTYATAPLIAVPPTGSNPWQHHHYIAPSSAAAFPPSQDRYVCATCNKAFSRPSSLRIHSHSHTGEKPFKCPHAGCGKAFSVRSNMKRHERGCHTFAGGAAGL